LRRHDFGVDGNRIWAACSLEGEDLNLIMTLKASLCCRSASVPAYNREQALVTGL